MKLFSQITFFLAYINAGLPIWCKGALRLKKCLKIGGDICFYEQKLQPPDSRHTASHALTKLSANAYMM